MDNQIKFVPLDVTLDDKFALLEAEFGLKAFAIVVKIFQKIYGVHGYYCEWTEDVALLFAKNNGVGGNVVSEIVEAAIRRGIFDNRLYKKYRILTSHGIQKRFLKAASRKARIEMKEAYLLINDTQNYKNVAILSENVTKTEKNVTDEAINKDNVNEINLNEINVNERASPSTAAFTVPQDIIDLYVSNGNYITKTVLDDMGEWINKVDVDVIKWAIGEAARHGAQGWAYIERILQTHYNAGRTTIDAVTAANNEFKKRTTRKAGDSNADRVFGEYLDEYKAAGWA